MATVIDTLVTVFTMDKRNFDTGAKDMKNTLQGLKSVAQAVGAVALFGYGAGLVKDFVNTNAELARFSDTIKDNIEDVQAWGRVLEKEGGSMQGLQNTLTKLSQMGRGLKEPTKILRAMADRMKGMNYWQAKMYGSKFGIDDATIRVLQKGGKEVDRLLKRAKSLGVYNKQQLEQSKKLKNTWQDLSQSISFLGGQIALTLLPALQWLADGFIQLGSFVNDNAEAVKDFLLFITGASIIKGLHALGIAGLKSVAWVAVWVAGIALAYLVFNDFMEFLRGGESVIGDIVNWFKSWDDVTGITNTALKALGAVLVALTLPFSTLTGLIGWLVGYGLAYLVDGFNNLYQKSRLLRGALEVLKAPFQAIYEFGQWIGEMITDLLLKIDGFFDKVQSIKDTVSGVLDLGGAWDGIKSMVGLGDEKSGNTTNNNKSTTINVDKMEFSNNSPTALQFTQNSANQFMNVVNQADAGGI